MKVEELIAMVTEDLVLDEYKLKNTMLKMPQLFSKYNNLLYTSKRELLILEEGSRVLYRKLFNELNNNNQYLTTNKEKEAIINNDEEYSKIILNIHRKKANIEYLENVVKKINNMGFDIKTLVEWIKYENGM